MLDVQADGDVHSSRLGGPPLARPPTTTDDVAQRVPKIGGTTLRSIDDRLRHGLPGRDNVPVRQKLRVPSPRGGDAQGIRAVDPALSLGTKSSCYASRPDNVRSWTTFRFIVRYAEVASENVAETEVFELSETSLMQFSRQFSWIEMAEPWLSDRSHLRADSGHISSAFRRIVFNGLGIVEHDLRLRRASDEAKRRRYCIARQIGHNAEPMEERRAIGLEPYGTQSISEAMLLEIYRRESQRRR